MTIRASLFIYLVGSLFLSGCNPAVGNDYRPTRPDYYQASPVSIADIAKQQLGKPYKFGGNGPSSFDCSGLVQYAYGQAGIKVPRQSLQQLRYAVKIPSHKLQSGDLVFFSVSENKISHVGIYLGNNQFIHSPSKGKRVQIVKLNHPYWQSRFVTAARIP